ncbi:hypothetical protein B5E77_04115 [Lachnoclostridium sp. An131]|uniref:hypothetical protein n=1 Tax=Lachnoclostridium sp. An131 TaxID=1965555 RepID=UPI000B38D404|nr:hypothetical protein [Lachnoclostridium sp. An131]OUQ28009.1 hypothetical protein B5E77_04115 [Lachnoclostridium sp. An131]
MKPLFLSELQERISRLPAGERQEIRLLVWVNKEQEYRKLCFEMPKGETLQGERELYRRYLLAMMNNLLVSFGGAGLELYFDETDQELKSLTEEAVAEFQADSPRNDRKSYGVYLNYINRMNVFLGLGRFAFQLKDLSAWPKLDPEKEYRIYVPQKEEEELKLLKRTATELEGRCICSLDVGGNSIKGAVVKDGRALVLKEYQWYPTGCRTAQEMNDPMLLMVRFLSACTGLMERDGNLAAAEAAFAKNVPYGQLLAETEALERSGICTKGRFDAIVIGFPDIVVHNKIAGGESFKHQGMKNNPDTDYEVEFFKTSDLDELAAPYAKEGAPVVVLNDGNAASYITSVEQTFAPESFIDENGMFCCTIGTEMGTGFISRGGTIQHIPLEGFQHVIDLGNEEYQKYPPADLRSVNSTNTGIPGVVQKYISQMGLFRMALTALWESKDPLFEKLQEMGLIAYNAGADTLYSVLEPEDRRGTLTRFLVSQLSEGCPAVEEAFRMMGKAMGILIDQDRLIFPEITTRRLLSGGIIADDRAFALMREGLRAYNPSYDVMRLDEETMYSPLLRSMTPEQRSFNVAIGSAYIGNRFLTEKNNG